MTDPISVLIIDNSYTFGGAINSLESLLKAVDKSVYRPIVVSGQSAGYLEEHFPGCAVYHFRPRLPWIDNSVYLAIRKLPLFRIAILKKVLNALRFLFWILWVHIPEAFIYTRIGKREGVSLVHLNNILGSQLSGILGARMLMVPCVAHLRDFEEVHPITRFYARMIQHHIAISTAIKDNLLQLGISENEITIVHDALDLKVFDSDLNIAHLRQQFNLCANQLCVGIFGRVVEWKGIRIFLKAARLVFDSVPDARAFVVGSRSDGNEAYYQKMIGLAKQLGIAERLVFTGYRRDVPAMMKLMDVIVHASTRPEPFGMVLIEGMAMNKPVVATRGGGPLDIVCDTVNGIMVEIGDHNALALAIIRLLRNPELRAQMGRAGRTRVRHHFSSDRYANQIETIYKNILCCREDHTTC